MAGSAHARQHADPGPGRDEPAGDAGRRGRAPLRLQARGDRHRALPQVAANPCTRLKCWLRRWHWRRCKIHFVRGQKMTDVALCTSSSDSPSCFTKQRVQSVSECCSSAERHAADSVGPCPASASDLHIVTSLCRSLCRTKRSARPVLAIELRATAQEDGPLTVDPAFLDTTDLHGCAASFDLKSCRRQALSLPSAGRVPRCCLAARSVLANMLIPPNSPLCCTSPWNRSASPQHMLSAQCLTSE